MAPAIHAAPAGTLPSVNDSLVLEVVEDFDAAVLRVEDDQQADKLLRRAMREALGHLYTLREYRKSQITDYESAAADDADGRVCEGLVFIRGLLIHRVARGHGPATTSYLGAYLKSRFPVTLIWLHDAEMPDPVSAARRRRGRGFEELLRNYENEVAGRVVESTLTDARRWLVESPVFPPLGDV